LVAAGEAENRALLDDDDDVDDDRMERGMKLLLLLPVWNAHENGVDNVYTDNAANNLMVNNNILCHHLPFTVW